jgi:hypothetical protein
LSFGGSVGESLKDAYFELSFEIIRYVNAMSLEEVEAILNDAGATVVGQYPFGKHLKVLDAVFAHVVAEQRWPTPLRFAIAHRDLGYVPRLVNDLSPAFIKRAFDDTEYSELELTSLALPILDREGVVQGRIVRIARALGPLWRKRDDGRVLEAELLQATGLSHAEAAPALLFMMDDGLFSSHSVAGTVTPGEWNFTLRDETALKLEEVESYEQYRGLLEARRRYAEAFLSGKPKEDSVPFKAELTDDLKAHLSFMQDAILREIALADIAELKVALDGGAHKMALVLLGSLLEGILVDVLSNNVKVAQSHIRNFPRAQLEELIKVATRFGLVSEGTTLLLAEFIRAHRNLIHPECLKTSGFRVSAGAVRVAIAAIQHIIEDLEHAASDRRLTAFQRRQP